MSERIPLVRFRSSPDMYDLESGGRKPNTVRILDSDDGKLDLAKEALASGRAAYIAIERTSGGETFCRRLADVTRVGELLGKSVWVLSWQHEDDR